MPDEKSHVCMWPRYTTRIVQKNNFDLFSDDLGLRRSPVIHSENKKARKKKKRTRRYSSTSYQVAHNNGGDLKRGTTG